MEKAHQFARFLAIACMAMIFSLADAKVCTSTKYVSIKVPSTWSSLYIVIDGVFYLVPSSSESNGWYTFSLDDYGPTGYTATSFFFTSEINGWNSAGIDTANYNTSFDQSYKFTCDMITDSTLYITEDESNLYHTYWGSVAPDAKYFYFLPPDDKDWFQGTAMMIVNDTDTTTLSPDTIMINGDEYCGWYKVNYFNEDPPTSVVFTLDLDPAAYVIGSEGWGAETVTPIDLNAMFTTYAASTSKLYFVSDEGADGWYSSFPSDDANIERQ
ncbi:MAG TPA: hypothetical protein VLM37_08150, partial [Fibrobacteraceae bacterium]|nr:hypothetical protein [Fibrobacteraceae bacterium]